MGVGSSSEYGIQDGFIYSKERADSINPCLDQEWSTSYMFSFSIVSINTMIEITATTSQHDLVTDVTDDTTEFEDYA